jgi:8-oxo-dGTP diphosphatase
LICQRRRDKTFPLKWEFPGGKAEAGESLEAAIARELTEELGIRPEIGGEIHRTTYQYPGQREPFQVVFFSAKISGRESFVLNEANLKAAFEQVLWVMPAELPTYDFLEANAELIDRVSKGSPSEM